MATFSKEVVSAFMAACEQAHVDPQDGITLSIPVRKGGKVVRTETRAMRGWDLSVSSRPFRAFAGTQVAKNIRVLENNTRSWDLLVNPDMIGVCPRDAKIVWSSQSQARVYELTYGQLVDAIAWFRSLTHGGANSETMKKASTDAWVAKRLYEPPAPDTVGQVTSKAATMIGTAVKPPAPRPATAKK